MLRLLAPLLLVLLLGGCASYDAQIARGPGLANVQSFFVIANANDSRGLAHRIAASLKAHGLTAGTGPRTMMPDDTQAVVTYDDHWGWDFGERLVHLQIKVRDARSSQPLAAATFSAKIPGRKSAAGIVDELVTRVLSGAKS
jgi:hypothetical protein